MRPRLLAGAGSSKSDDDTKRRFREALDRKMAKSTGGSEHKDGAARRLRRL
ncbi:hypothetical protein MAHJHV57_50470 [Mycobacterium avium subsp. hominissuis]